MKNLLLSTLRRLGVSACLVMAALFGLSSEAQALSCPAGKVSDGGLCYSPPRAGYSCTGAACMENCPSGYSPSVPGFCHFGGSLTYTEKPYGKKHDSTPHKCLLLYYANCRADYRMDVCGICSYKGAWDTTRHTYFREPGISPDFTQAFTNLPSTVQATYGDSIGAIQSGYYSAVAAIQKAIDAVTLKLFHDAAKATMASSGLGTTMSKAIAAFKTAKADANNLNDMKRILALVAANKNISNDPAAVKDIATVMLANATKLGLLSAAQTSTQASTKSATDATTTSTSNVDNSSLGIYTAAGGAWIAGVDQTFGIIMNTKKDADGSYKFAVLTSTGGSLGFAAIAGADIGFMWNPGTVDKQGGAYVGLVGAADIGLGGGASVSWSVAKGMRGAQNAIPGVSGGTGVGVGGQLSLIGGNAWILQKFSFTP